MLMDRNEVRSWVDDLRSIVDALPKCGAAGCAFIATMNAYPPEEDGEVHRCDTHGPPAPYETHDLPHAHAVRALRAKKDPQCSS